MARNKILALILAGGKGSRLEVLTAQRAKPAMPYAGVYRLIDFALSNCVHSGISDVWVIEQYQLHSLNEHLANGRPWDLDRTYGGLQVLPPYENGDDEADDEGGFAEGNADAIYRHKAFIRDFAPDILVVLSADHIYKLDYGDVIEQHLTRKAAVTIVTTQVPIEEANRFGTVQVNAEGQVTHFEYKPEKPQSDLVTTEVFVYNTQMLLKTLDDLAAEGKDNNDDDDSATESGLKDFGHQLLPKLVKDGQAYAYPLSGYWRDVGTVESYWQSHMDLLQPESGLVLDDPRWPILTFGAQRLPARIHTSARIEDSLISPGCTISGHVIRSVIAPGVIVEEGAVVQDSILLHKTVVERGATVIRAILDEEVHVGKDAIIGAQQSELHDNQTAKSIALVGGQARISAGARIAADARIEPGAIVVEKPDQQQKHHA